MERAKIAGILRLVAGIIICLGLVFTNFAQGYPETTDPEAGMLFFATYRYRDNSEAVNSPYLIGALLTFYWSEIETEENVYGRAGTLMEVMKATERIRCSYLGVYPQDVLKGMPNPGRLRRGV